MKRYVRVVSIAGSRENVYSFIDGLRQAFDEGWVGIGIPGEDEALAIEFNEDDEEGGSLYWSSRIEEVEE